MKKRIISMILAMCMVLAMLPGTAKATGQLTVTKTDIQADSVFNSGGYGSLRNGNHSALVDREGKLLFPYVETTWRYYYSDGIVSLSGDDITDEDFIFNEYETDEGDFDYYYEVFLDSAEYYHLDGSRAFILDPEEKDYVEDSVHYTEKSRFLGTPMRGGYALILKATDSSWNGGWAGGSGTDYHAYIIDKTGKILYALPEELTVVAGMGAGGFGLEYDFGWFGEGLIAYGADGNNWYMDTTGQNVIDLCDSDIVNMRPFHEGLAAVKNYDDLYGFIDKTGTQIIPCMYDGTTEFGNDGLCGAARDGKYGYIDRENNVVIPFEYDEAYGAYDGLASVGKDGKFGLVDYNNRVMLPLEYDDISSFEDGVAYAVKDGYLYIITGDTYIYDATDPGTDIFLDVDRLNTVADIASAVSAVSSQVQSMTPEQKASAAGIDLATLYAETAAARASSHAVDSGDILINAALLSKLEPTAIEASEAVETALTDGGVTTARYLSKTVILATDETSVSVRIDPDVLTTSVDKVRVETPAYALTFKFSDLEPDLTHVLTFTAEAVNPMARTASNAVSIALPEGGTTNSVTVSLPSDSDDPTYQTVATTDGTATASKYNPATTNMDGKVNRSGTYTVITNEKDFTDIGDKSQEMQDAIRYLASKGIIGGRTATTFDPDGSITRAEIATLLVKALGKLDPSATTNFSDVKPSNWYYSAAASSQKHGLINGFGDNTFRGTTDINKVQIVVVSSRVLTSEMKYKTPSDPSGYLSRYSDSVSKWAQPEVALATRENLVVYRTDGTFSGDKNMTRGDAAIIIYRLFQRIW